MTGIAFFILGANLAGRLAGRFGSDPRMVALLAVPVNLGFGFRGPPGFYHAVLAARGDDARGAALVILFILLTAAAGTAAAAPFITLGLPALTAFAAAISTAAVLCLLLLPKIEPQAGASSAGTVSSIQPPPSTLDPS